jgi:hypothetical protein
MNLKCPACGAKVDLDQAVREADLEALVKAAAAFGPDWQLVSEYLDCFRARVGGALALKKRLRLAREVWEIYHSGRFASGRQWYRVDRPEFLAALVQVCNRHLFDLRNHNYLKQVLKGAAEESGRRLEAELREREGRLQAGLREEAFPRVAEAPEDPEWRAKFQRLLKRSVAPGLSPEEKARRQQEFQAHLTTSRDKAGDQERGGCKRG